MYLYFPAINSIADHKGNLCDIDNFINRDKFIQEDAINQQVGHIFGKRNSFNGWSYSSLTPLLRNITYFYPARNVIKLNLIAKVKCENFAYKNIYDIHKMNRTYYFYNMPNKLSDHFLTYTRGNHGGLQEYDISFIDDDNKYSRFLLITADTLLNFIHSRRYNNFKVKIIDICLEKL